MLKLYTANKKRCKTSLYNGLKISFTLRLPRWEITYSWFHIFLNILCDKIVTKSNLSLIEQQSQSTDTWLWWRKIQYLLQGARNTGSSCLKDPNSSSFPGRFLKKVWGNRLHAETNMRTLSVLKHENPQLSSVNPNIKEICKNVKQCHYSY